MRLLLGLVAGVVVGWYLGRDYEWRQWETACETPLPDPMDAVQGADIYTLNVNVPDDGDLERVKQMVVSAIAKYRAQPDMADQWRYNP